MDRDVARELYAVYERASSVLNDAEAIIWRMPEGEERKQHMLALAELFVDITINLKAPLVGQYPDLDTNLPDGRPDTVLEPEDQMAVSHLTATDVDLVDK